MAVSRLVASEGPAAIKTENIKYTTLHLDCHHMAVRMLSHCLKGSANPHHRKLFRHHHIIPSWHHTIMSSYHHIIISSCHHTIMSSYHHIIISSCHHNIIISSYHHIIIASSYRHTIIPSANKKNFEPLENREDRSDFDDSWTTSITPTQSKCSRRRKTNCATTKSFRNERTNEKFSVALPRQRTALTVTKCRPPHLRSFWCFLAVSALAISQPQKQHSVDLLALRLSPHA